MYTQSHPPISLTVCGALSGLACGGSDQLFAFWVGAITGASLGCTICIYKVVTLDKSVRLPIQDLQPVIVHNTYITHENGQPKDIQIENVAV